MLKLPTSSRYTQHCQHIISGIKECITPIVAGTAALYATGNTSFWIMVIPFTVTFILGRLSSEISYQTSIRIIQEHMKK